MSAASAIERAEEFIWNNARLIDRRRHEYHFRSGSREAVVAALAALIRDLQEGNLKAET